MNRCSPFCLVQHKFWHDIDNRGFRTGLPWKTFVLGKKNRLLKNIRCRRYCCKTCRTCTYRRNWSPRNRNRRTCRLHRSQDYPNKKYRYRRSWSRHIRSHRKPPSHCNPGWIYRTCTSNSCCKTHSHRCRTCQRRHSRDWTYRKYTGHRSCIRHSHRYSSWKKPYIRGGWYSRCSYRRRRFPILHILPNSWKNCI